MKTPKGGQYEQKYAFRNAERGLLERMLDVLCEPDPEYFRGIISSLYYDSPDLALLREKVDSDYVKTKVRIRWYQATDDSRLPSEVPCYAEVKRKVGSVRQKQRRKVIVNAADLRAPFESPKLREVVQAAWSCGFAPEHPLVPSGLIEYERVRYVERRTEARISLDTNIRCTALNPRLTLGFGAQKLNEGVLEVKGRHTEFPVALYPLGPYLRRCAFSKYARAVAMCVDPSNVQT